MSAYTEESHTPSRKKGETVCPRKDEHEGVEAKEVWRLKNAGNGHGYAGVRLRATRLRVQRLRTGRASLTLVYIHAR